MTKKIDLSKFVDREYLPEIPEVKVSYIPQPRDPKEYLARCHPRQLLDYLQGARISGGIHEGRGAGATLQDIKDALAKHPHLPNKAEGKMLRKIIAETKMTEEQVREIPKYREMLANAA